MLNIRESVIDMKNLLDQNELAKIEYHGTAGITKSSIMAVSRFIHFGDIIKKAFILSYLKGTSGSHSLLLVMDDDTYVAIKSGFNSGYLGEGPRGLSTVLKILIRHNVEIDEHEIDSLIHARLNGSCLLKSDLELIERQEPIRPIRYYDYIDESSFPNGYSNDNLKGYFPPSINFGLLDERLIDLGLDFYNNTDHAINSAFRRLEDAVRERTGLYDEIGSKLFSKAFEGESSILHWGDSNSGEHSGKANLFKAIFAAYRNPRAHQEIKSNSHDSLREFMLINELFILEKRAFERVD